VNPPAGAGRPTTVGNPVCPDRAGSAVEGLTLGPGLVLPVEAVTETFAILAKRGDPVGVWWGLRSFADGTAEGLPVVIFGG